MLFVDGRLLDTRTKTWTALPEGWDHAQLAPNAHRAVRASPVEILDLRTGSTQVLAAPSSSRMRSATWKTAEEVLVLEVHDDWSQTCRSWRGHGPASVVPCPESAYHLLDDVRHDPHGLVVVTSSGEGHPAVEIQHPRGVEVPSPDLYPHGPMEVSVGPTADIVWATSPCDLRQSRGCVATTEQTAPPTHVFRWRADRPKRWKRVYADLPPRSTYDPFSGRVAWTSPEQVCWGPPGDPPTCVSR